LIGTAGFFVYGLSQSILSGQIVITSCGTPVTCKDPGQLEWSFSNTNHLERRWNFINNTISLLNVCVILVSVKTGNDVVDTSVQF